MASFISRIWLLGAIVVLLVPMLTMAVALAESQPQLAATQDPTVAERSLARQTSTVVSEPGLQGAAAVEPAGAIEELYKLELLPRLRPAARCKMFSSYDRSGGNNDGFGGTYSKLRLEDGNSVLAEMKGAGCIQRIWFTHSEYEKPGLLGLKKEHIQVYIDGQAKPALDVSLEDLFGGKLKRFPAPLVGEALGGFYCYVPIPYRDGCKVVVEGSFVRFYQLTYREFPSAQDTASFRMEPSAEEQKALDAAVHAWSNLGDLAALGVKDARETAVDVSLAAGETRTIDLPPGAGMVRAVYFEGTPELKKQAVSARLKFRWDNSSSDGVDVPLGYFFGQALEPGPYRSLLVGDSAAGLYNFMPMPYRRAASVGIVSEKPFGGRLRILTTDRADGEAWGYFHATYREELPPQPGKHFTFLRREGKGHYLGTYLVTEGQTDRRLPLWLEGDDRFTVDGEMVIHGTGSEDYFNCGWYAVEGRLNGPGARALHGFPVYRLAGERNQAVAFRWHLTDPVHYDRSIVAEMEHGGDNQQPAEYRSAAFYYDTRAGL